MPLQVCVWKSLDCRCTVSVPPSVHVSIHSSFGLSTYPSVCPPIRPPIHRSVRLFLGGDRNRGGRRRDIHAESNADGNGMCHFAAKSGHLWWYCVPCVMDIITSVQCASLMPSSSSSRGISSSHCCLQRKEKEREHALDGRFSCFLLLDSQLLCCFVIANFSAVMVQGRIPHSRITCSKKKITP